MDLQHYMHNFICASDRTGAHCS